MAPKRPLGNPSPASSSDDEEEDLSEDEEMEEAQQQGQQVDDEEEESDEEESDEDEEEAQSKQSIAMKTQASKVNEEESGSSDDDSEEETLPEVEASTPKPSTEISKKKRALESPKQMAETSAKKAKGSVSSASFQRIWSDEDVITILEAMISFKEEKGAEPSHAEMTDFYESIKGSIHIQVSKSQLSDKFRTLKKKYQNNAKRGQDGEDPVFSKPHEHQTFQLSKLLWADASSNGNVLESAKKSNKKSKAVKTDQSFEELLAARVDAGADEFWANYPSLNQYKDLLPEKLRSMIPLVRRSKVKEMDEKWQKFNKKEMELAMKKTQLFLDVSKAMGFGQGN